MIIQIQAAKGKLLAAKAVTFRTILAPLACLEDMTRKDYGDNVCICCLSLALVEPDKYFATYEVRELDNEASWC